MPAPAARPTLHQLDDAIRTHLDRAKQQGGSAWRALSQTRIVLGVILAAVVAYLAIAWHKADNSEQVLKTLTVLAAAATFTLSYLQWRMARQEAAFDRYYDRLGIANACINAVGLKAAATPAAELDHLQNMQVFAQLDNFEYIFGKYQLNYVDYSLVDRAVRTLRSDCDQPWFREKVLFWIGAQEGRQVAKGYHRTTRQVARFIAQNQAQN